MIALFLPLVMAAEVVTPSGPLSGGGVHGSESARLRFGGVPRTLPGVEGIRFESCPSSWFSPGYCDGDPTHVLDYQELVNRFSVNATGSRWNLALQGDAVALFSNRYILDGELQRERDLYEDGVANIFPDALIVLEKASLEYRGQAFSFTLGDTWSSFGRGTALNLVKNTDVDVDTSLRGLRAGYSSSNWELTALTAFTNPQQVTLENPNENLAVDDGHAIHAIRAQRYGLGPATVASHLVLVQYNPTPGEAFAAWNQPVGALVGGGSVGLTGAAYELYLESDGYAYNDPAIPVSGGAAVYASGSAYIGAASLLLEAKYSKNTEYINTPTGGYGYEIAAGPTLEYERVITEDSSATVNSNDLIGAKLRADFGVPLPAGNLAPFVSAAVFRDSDLAGLHFNRSPETVIHPIAGFILVNGGFDAQLRAGFRADLRDPIDGVSQGSDRMGHADGEVTVPVVGPLSLSLSVSAMGYAWGDNYPQQQNFFDSANALAIHVGRPLAVIFYGEYSSNPLVNSTGNLDDDLYGAVELQWKPKSATTIKAFYGAYRAGIHCAGGQCRYLPGFEGAKFSIDTTF